MAMSLSLFVIHLFGDMPSPPVIGMFIDITGSQRLAMSIALIYGLGMSLILWWIAWKKAKGIAKREKDALLSEV